MCIRDRSIAHRFIKEHARPGDFWIDGTAGRGYDTAFLCELVGEEGRVLSFDIQEDAIESTKALLREKEFSWAQVIADSHSNMERYAKEGKVDGIVFNFGYLPGGDHSICTLSLIHICLRNCSGFHADHGVLWRKSRR